VPPGGLHGNDGGRQTECEHARAVFESRALMTAKNRAR
jgi:hypothetical protein